jgi:hypothetical protein
MAPPRKKGKLSRSARHYRKSAKSRAKKKKYDTKFNKKKSQRKKRSELTKIRRKAKKAGKKLAGKDISHTKYGIRIKDSSKNRGSKSDRPGDRRARGKKRKTRKTRKTRKPGK